MGKDLFSAWVIPNPAYSKEESKVPVTVIQYTKRDLSPQAVSEALKLINEIWDCLHNKNHMKRSAFSLDTPYDTIRVLTVQQYLDLIV